MGRPRKLIEDLDLFRWQRQHMRDGSMGYVKREEGDPHCNPEDRRATLWFMHQFDAVIMWQAFTGAKPSRSRNYHRSDTWDVHRIIRKYIEFLEDDTGQVTPATKLAALEKLREFQRVGASLHKEFLASIGKLGPDAESKALTELADPIVLSLTGKQVS